MVILQGKSVFGGVAIGKIQFFKRDEIQIKRRHVDDPEAEIRRFRTARKKHFLNCSSYMTRHLLMWEKQMP